MKTINKIIEKKFNELSKEAYKKIENNDFTSVQDVPALSQKSFYGKCKVYYININNINYEIMMSYDTIIFIRDNNLNILYNNLHFSQTTTKHIKSYLNYYCSINNNSLKELEKELELYNYRKFKLEELNNYYNLDFYYYQLMSDEINILINSDLLDEYEEEEITEDYKNTFKNILNCLKIDFKNLYVYLHKNYYHDNLYNLTVEITR